MIVAMGGGGTGIVEVYTPAYSQTQTAWNMRLAGSREALREKGSLWKQNNKRDNGPARDQGIEERIKRTGGNRVQSINGPSEATAANDAIGCCIRNDSYSCRLALTVEITCPAPGLVHGGGAEASGCTAGNCSPAGLARCWVARNGCVRNRSRRDGRGRRCGAGNRRG